MVNLLKEKLTANEIRCHRYDCITTMCRPSYIPAMHRIHGGTPATAVRSGSRPAPPDSRYLADQKGSGRPLRYRIQAMGEKEVTDCKKKYTVNDLVRRGRPLTSQTAFGGQLPYKGSLVRSVARFHHIPLSIMAGFYEPRASVMASAIHTSRGGTPFGRPLRYRIQTIKFYVAVCRICRGCPSGQPAREISSQPIRV